MYLGIVLAGVDAKLNFGGILGVSWKPGFVARASKNTSYPIGVGPLGHFLRVSWKARFVFKSCKDMSYPVGVGLF